MENYHPGIEPESKSTWPNVLTAPGSWRPCARQWIWWASLQRCLCLVLSPSTKHRVPDGSVCSRPGGPTPTSKGPLPWLLSSWFSCLFQFQGVTTRFAPAMAPAKELAAPAAAPTVVAMQEVPPSLTEAPIPPEEVWDEAEGAAYAEVTPSPAPVEETKALAPMPTPTAPADRGGGPTVRDDATATAMATPAPLVGTALPTSTPPLAAAMEVPVEKEAEAPVAPAAVPMATPEPQMTTTPLPAAPLPVSAPTDTPTPLATPTAAATVIPAPTATPLSMAKAPAEVRPTERSRTTSEAPKASTDAAASGRSLPLPAGDIPHRSDSDRQATQRNLTRKRGRAESVESCYSAKSSQAARVG
jgi:hypothetical protein